MHSFDDSNDNILKFQTTFRLHSIKIELFSKIQISRFFLAMHAFRAAANVCTRITAVTYNCVYRAGKIQSNLSQSIRMPTNLYNHIHFGPRAIQVTSPFVSRSLYTRKTGSHYDNVSMVNAKNPDLPTDPVLADIACRVFGTSPTSNPHARSVRKLLLKPLIGEAVSSYYPKYPRHNKLGYIDPARVRAEAKLERLKRRGKGPPKKGQGKRAQKKK